MTLDTARRDTHAHRPGSRPRAPQPARRAGRNWLGILSVPGLAFAIVFIGWPLVEIARRSFFDPSPRVFADFFASSLYVSTLLRTFALSLAATVVTLLLAYPYAWIAAHVGPRLRSVLLLATLVPILTSFLVRVIGLQLWIQDPGVLSSLLNGAGLTSGPIGLMRTNSAVLIGVAQALLPYLVLPIYSVMRRIDDVYMTAAHSLGAPRPKAFLRVYLPMSLPGVYAGSILVFLIALGFYVAPAVLGGPKSTMISTLIVQLVQNFGDFSMASAAAVILLVVTLICLAFGSRLAKVSDIFGTQVR